MYIYVQDIYIYIHICIHIYPTTRDILHFVYIYIFYHHVFYIILYFYHHVHPYTPISLYISIYHFNIYQCYYLCVLFSISVSVHVYAYIDLSLDLYTYIDMYSSRPRNIAKRANSLDTNNRGIHSPRVYYPRISLARARDAPRGKMSRARGGEARDKEEN